MLAAASKELDLIGITTVSGNVPASMGAKNALKILSMIGKTDVPVYVGEETPLVRDYVDAMDTHGMDGLGESGWPDVKELTPKTDAVSFLIETLKTTPDVTILALGPMTNLATLLEQDRVAFDQIEEFVSMGGSFKSHGNCSPVAEYNYWCDPDAAAKVYDAMYQNGRKIHMIGLDVTREIVLTPTILEYMCRINAKRGAFIKKITKFYFDFHWQWEHIVGCVINDPLAVAYFIDPSICEGFESFVQIETEGISLGQSVVDSMNFYRKEPNAKVLTQVDTYRFFEMMLSRVLEVEPESLDILENVL